MITFEVLACNDAHVLLAKYFKNTKPAESYEVVFGCSSNTKVEIRDGAGVSIQLLNYHTLNFVVQGVLLASYSESGLMNCAEYRAFWISWDGRKIRAGKGGSYGLQ